MDTHRLPFPAAVEALTVAAHRDGSGYWRVVVTCRRGLQSWDEARQQTFDLLDSGELLDALAAHLEHELNTARG